MQLRNREVREREGASYNNGDSTSGSQTLWQSHDANENSFFSPVLCSMGGDSEREAPSTCCTQFNDTW